MLLWRSSFYVKMKSLNKLGGGVGSHAGAKPWILAYGLDLAGVRSIQIQLYYELSAQRGGNMGQH